jgi:hypothetical protein
LTGGGRGGLPTPFSGREGSRVGEREVEDDGAGDSGDERTAVAVANPLVEEPLGDSRNRAESKHAAARQAYAVDDAADRRRGEGIGVEGSRVAAANGNSRGCAPLREDGRHAPLDVVVGVVPDLDTRHVRQRVADTRGEADA